MCGISGAYWNDAENEIDRHLFERAVNALSHRGPDHQGTWLAKGIALGHTRLSIIDTSSAANQPFFAPDRSCAIVFNGEIFNYRELAGQLRNEGVTLHTASDTEVLLHLLMRKGMDALRSVKGFFAFAFYRVHTHELIVARDRFGEKPLFYTYDPGSKRLHFGSELKAVLPFVTRKEIDFDALQLLLQLTYIPAPLTVLKQVRKLEPGTFLHVSANGLAVRRFYELPVVTAQNITETQAVAGIREHMLRAVESRMVADVPVAGFLSGGIDSSIVSVLAHRLNPAYETFSLGFSDARMFDETPDAELAAKQFGIRHHGIRLTETQLLENVEELLDRTDEPFGDSSAIALYSLCKTVKGKYKVVLSGDGADEVFGGYHKHYALHVSQQKKWYAPFLRHAGIVHHILPKSRNSRLGNKARQLEKMREVLGKGPFERYWHLATFNHGWSNKILSQGSDQDFRQRLQKWQAAGMNDYLRLDMELVLPGDMLYKVDMASMLNAVEIRSPFMDHELVEYAFTLPGEWKVKNGEKKYLLKKAFADLLPPALLQKPKHGFEVPLQRWLNGPLQYLTRQYLSPGFLHEQNIFDVPAVAQLLRKLNSSRPGDTAALVWTLLCFQKTWSTHLHG